MIQRIRRAHFDLNSYRYVIASESYVSDDIRVGQNVFCDDGTAVIIIKITFDII